MRTIELEEDYILPTIAHKKRVFLSPDDQQRFIVLREQILKQQERERDKRVKAFLGLYCHEEFDVDLNLLHQELCKQKTLDGRKKVLRQWLSLMSWNVS